VAINQSQHFTRSHLGSRLTVHFVPDPDATAVATGFLLMRGERLDLSTDHLTQLPLTEREREVLVTAGKTNGEIATIFAISARAVQKHLKHIFQKLGVETRTAVAVRALSAADDHTAA
jgi:DNA-binding NarL/FixJ family response regulator